jgi:hypothetical protein
MLAMPQPPDVTTEDFVNVLFTDDDVIEIRLIEEGKKKGKVRKRVWFNKDELLVNLDVMYDYCEAHRCALFYGVLPRKEKQGGKIKDVTHGRVVWMDIDYKDYEYDEDLAMKAIREFEVQPSIEVESGHGVHCYWVLHEYEHPSDLSGVSRSLAKELGGDHTFDAARLMRLPGSVNYKEQPKRTQIVRWSDEEVDFSRIEDLVGHGDRAIGKPAEGSSFEMPSVMDVHELPEKVLDVFDEYPRIRNLFEGRGKADVSSTGEKLDRTSSGYDASVAFWLLRKGVKPEEVAEALAMRPDQQARVKGGRYIGRTVAAAARMVDAWEKREPVKAGKSKPDFDVVKAIIYASDKPIYELHVESDRGEDGVLALSLEELSSPNYFRNKFLATFRRVPTLPTDVNTWRSYINQWLRNATEVAQPDDASDLAITLDEIKDIIANMVTGDTLRELNRGMAIPVGDDRGFRTAGVLGRLKLKRISLSANQLGRHLRKLGYQTRPIELEGKVVAVWVKTGKRKDEE